MADIDTTTDDVAEATQRRHPEVPQAEIDRLNLVHALKDFEVANARVVDLTARLTTLQEQYLSLQHEATMYRLQNASADDLRARADFLEYERNVARTEAAQLRASRSFRIGSMITRVLRKLMP